MLKRALLIILLILVFAGVGSCDDPQSWVKSIDSVMMDSVEKVASGSMGYVASGSVEDAAAFVWLDRNSGKVMGNSSYQPPGASSTSYAFVHLDDTSIVALVSSKIDDEYMCELVHASADGVEQIARLFELQDFACDAIETTNDGYIVSGYSYKRKMLFLGRYDRSGQEFWIQRYSGFGYSHRSSLELIGDEILLGGTYNPSNTMQQFPRVYSINLDGDTVRTFGMYNDAHHLARMNGIASNGDGNWFGYGYVHGEYLQAATYDFDNDESAYYREGQYNNFHSACYRNDGSHAMIGYTVLPSDVIDADYEAFFVAIDADGAEQRMLIGNKDIQDVGKDVICLSDGWLLAIQTEGVVELQRFVVGE